ncbi:MAG TPA: hypothetical protein VKR83_09890 [Ktedonobacteraceae bacterium]|nr:hypothetical protein [Ktedonobacteraceae bacterium]
MPTVGMNTDITPLVNALVAGNRDQMTGIARELVAGGAGASELIGRIGIVAAQGDSEGHVILALAAASMMSRWFVSLQHLLGEDPMDHRRELPLLIQAAAAAIPAVQAAQGQQVSYPEPLFPSDLPEGQTVGSKMHEAVFKNDAHTVERLLFGLYGTGADYRTLCIRLYDAVSTTFQQAGHPFMFAVRGFQLLDAVEWSTRTPNILHWLAPHVPVQTAEPVWVETVRSFLAEPSHSLASYRTRLAAPKEENALPLRRLILSDASMPQICQGVFDALMKNGASSRGIGSVLALTATDLVQRVGDADRKAFVDTAHGLLYTAATRLALTQVQEVEALPLLFMSACYLHALYTEQAEQPAQASAAQASATRSNILGGGLIAPALLETLGEQLEAQDLNGALATARRYIQLGHDSRAMFAILALAAAKADAAADQGHTLQITQAAGEEFMAWPAALRDTNTDGLLHVALRAVVRQ